MKLKDALIFGHEAGLITIGEAIDNICYHSMMLFPYEDVAKEESELIEDFDRLKVPDDTLISDVLLNSYGIDTKVIDDEMDADLKALNEKQFGNKTNSL